MLIQTLQGSKASMAKVETLIPRTVPSPIGRLVLFLAMPVKELLGHGPVGIVLAHKGKEGLAVHGAGLGARARLDVVRDTGCSGVGLVAERARDLDGGVGGLAGLVVGTRSEMLFFVFMIASVTGELYSFFLFFCFQGWYVYVLFTC